MKKITKLFLVLVLGLAIVLPVQVSAATRHREPRVYMYNDLQYKYGMNQFRINELCPSPAVFSWLDNGIPQDAMGYYNPGAVDFRTDRIVDRGYGVVDSGYHFHKFGAKINDGRTIDFWACVDRNNKSSNCNNCLDKLLYAY